MEQRLDSTYLRPDPIERITAVGIGAVCVGAGIYFAALGFSLLWRYTPPEIAIRIANPEVHIAQDSPLKVSQDKPFEVEQPEPLKIDPPKVFVRVEETPPRTSAAPTTTEGDVIRREVTVFSKVRHGAGTVVTGWNYRDGGGGVPVQQYCYYTTPDIDRSSTRVDIAANRVRLPNLDAGLVPDLEDALTKCQWWQE
jgi:hypothetical protein